MSRVLAIVLKADRLSIVAAYAGCVAIWGTTWLGIKVSLNYVPPIAGAGLRFLVAGTILYAAALVTGKLRKALQPPIHLVVVLATTMFGVNYALTYTAETHLASGLVAVLFGTLPFFVFGFAHFMIRERATLYTIVGAAIAFAGVATISLAGDFRADIPYVLAALGASASSAYATVYLKRYADAEPLTTLAPAMLLAGLVLAVVGTRVEGVDWTAAASLPSLGAIAYLAICGSSIAFYLNHWLLQRIDSGVMGLSALMIPVVAVSVGALKAHEAFGARDIIGAILVIGGVGLSMTSPSQIAPITSPDEATSGARSHP